MPTPVPDWRDDASCNGRDPDMFFPDPSDHVRVAKAEAICGFCPVIDQCRALARANREEFGVWAGSLRYRTTNQNGASNEA